jgi:hypothetical protein
MTAFMLSFMAASAAPADFQHGLDDPMEVQISTISFDMSNHSDSSGGGHGQEDLNVHYMSDDNGSWDDPDENDGADSADDDSADNADGTDDGGDVNVTEPGILDYGLSTYAGGPLNEGYMGGFHPCVNDSDADGNANDDAEENEENGTEPGDVNVTEPGILDFGMSTYTVGQMNDVYMGSVHYCVNDTDDSANDDGTDPGDVNGSKPGILDYGMSTYTGGQMNDVYMGSVHYCVNDTDDSADDDDDATDPGNNNGTDPDKRPPVFEPYGAISYNTAPLDPMMRY